MWRTGRITFPDGRSISTSACPTKLVEKVTPLLPDWAGLLVSGDYKCWVVRPAPANEASEKLSVKDSIRLIRVLGNQILSTEKTLASLRSQLIEGYEPYGIEYQI